jgi:hypothetical protein
MERNPETAARNAALSVFSSPRYSSANLDVNAIQLISEAIAAAIKAYNEAKL